MDRTSSGERRVVVAARVLSPPGTARSPPALRGTRLVRPPGAAFAAGAPLAGGAAGAGAALAVAPLPLLPALAGVRRGARGGFSVRRRGAAGGACSAALPSASSE